MDITPLIPKDALVINGYGDDYFLINQQKIFDNIYIYRNKFSSWQLKSEAIELVKGFDSFPEIVLIGEGRGVFKPSRELAHKFAQHNIAIEFMDTPAACRAYNILLAEGRDICVFLKI